MTSFPTLAERREGVRAAKARLSVLHGWKRRFRSRGITHVTFGNLEAIAKFIVANAEGLSGADLAEFLRIVRLVGLARNGPNGRGEAAIRECMKGFPFAREVMARKELNPGSFARPDELMYAIRRSNVADVQSILFLVQQYSE